MPEGEVVVLAFDYGTRFVGMALGELRTGLVRPLDSAECHTRQSRWDYIEQAVKDWSPHHLLVGLALNQDGEEQTTSRQCRNFARDLHRHTHLPVTLIDERYTSLEADRQLRQQGMSRIARRHQEHAVAAAILIDSYFHYSPDERSRLSTLEYPETLITALPKDGPCSIPS